MSKVKVAINGFGRIGRLVLRASRGYDELDIVAVNDITDAKTLAHLLKYDSIHGRYPGEVGVDGSDLIVDGKRIPVLAEKAPENLPWKTLGVQVVVESTGIFSSPAKLALHRRAGAGWVILSAPSKKDPDGKDVDATIVMGVNDGILDPEKHRLISNASCTTNCLAPMAKAVHDAFGIENGLMITIHAYTNDQRILDLPHSDLRRARAACLSMIPTTTGAAKAVALVIPELKGRLNGYAVRVPTPTVSLVDLTVTTARPVTVESVNQALRAACSQGPLAPYMVYCDEPLVSVDFRGHPASCIIDALSTMAIGANLVKVVGWYDNEWGYSCRTRDLAIKLGREIAS